MKRWIVVVVIVALAAGGGIWGWKAWSKRQAEVHYRTVAAERGDLVQTVRATGVVQPLDVVQVGTQVNGPVLKLYADFNSRVKSGEVIAQIDPAVYEARLAQDDANLQQSLASVDSAKAKLAQADKDLARSRELAKRDLVSPSDLDAAVATRDWLAAGVKVAEAGVAQSRASLRMSKANLDYTTIRAPVDGVVVSRSVNEGQTVVASMSAQTLFVLATDLSHMQVEAAIPEADIGRIRPGQPVTFTVDAYDEDFTGKVEEVRLAAATVQNVVTYPVIIQAENPGEKLFPTMTANLSCEVARRANVLRVPNMALRFRPESETAKADAPQRRRPSAGGGASRDGHRVWIVTAEGLRPLRVRTGITDGTLTEITGGELEEGQKVITGVQSAADNGKAQAATVIPFAPPRMPGGGGGRSR